MQQEILKKVARNLPVYTRMPDGGETATKSTLVHSLLEERCRSSNYVIIEKKQQKLSHTCCQRDTSYRLNNHAGTEGPGI